MIPLAVPDLTGREAEYTSEAIGSGWVSGGGPYVDRFEEMVAKACGKKWCVATLSGTSALHLALASVGIGGQVGIPSFTYVAAANVITYLGAEPAFRDIGPGWSCDVTRIGRVVDAAPALGNLPWGGGLFCLSFNGNKIVTTGQGGAVLGDDADQERHVRHLANNAKTSPYEYSATGFNYRMANINAAIGCAQMERFEEFRDRKARIMARYLDAGLPLLQSCWMALWRTDRRDEKIRALREKGIDARPFWKPLHMQDPYKLCERTPLPNTMAIWDKLICLPCSTSLTESDQDRVIDACLSLRLAGPTHARSAV